ncbi:hypothetical protein [Effusibacillus consociatus]|uniref:Uncharacterized protein n=1 Tax=Effusibacillus consociatus TaxID=1117041 RepID=A0ABV9PYW0_9BACL
MKKILTFAFVATMSLEGTAFASGQDVAECATSSDQCPMHQ